MTDDNLNTECSIRSRISTIFKKTFHSDAAPTKSPEFYCTACKVTVMTFLQPAVVWITSRLVEAIGCSDFTAQTIRTIIGHNGALAELDIIRKISEYEKQFNK